MIWIGIDSGVTGAVAMIHPGGVTVRDLPVMVVGAGFVKRAVSGTLLAALMREMLPGDLMAAASVLLERTSARPGQGVASMYSMGRSYGVIEGALGALGMRHREVSPATWKAHFGLIGADKGRSRTIALQRYPELAPQLARAMDHNRAEAILLAEYLRETGAPAAPGRTKGSKHKASEY